MVRDKNIAIKTAELLLQIKAIKLQPQEPFTWASGWKSPIYCDNRVTLSYPVIRNFLKEQLATRMETLYGKPDVIAGVATGAIGIGMLVADYMNLPFIYVRPEAKKHGRQNQIEGHLEKGQKVVVIEDLISTGKSSINAAEALQVAGADVKGMLALFSYGFDFAVDNFKKHNLELTTLSDYDHLIDQATQAGHFKGEEIELLKSWRKDPSNWNV
ncbi:orotate phosphoribosyltransferase [Nonlabens sp. Ci31]|jgi:orotate phosphoribosyltransferase|uniref:orotate phosphoribosyltransferase n=1 Tax=Nonlabens sp. Ci31 TaxID=2608253 RepID=UPI0014649816|nr:orotate phosphoribosyltransferase [Nonlabens sp. Ci31]QJP34454.1 orotate phosphoribosyltransferase [Nonlabens sp. Ci31]